MTQAHSSTAKDPYFFDREDLQTIADERSVGQGLAFYKENRVIEVDQDDALLWGKVEDPDYAVPHDAEISLDGEDALSLRCTCGAARDDSACRHVVAVLFAYADQCGESNELISAVDNAPRIRLHLAADAAHKLRSVEIRDRIRTLGRVPGVKAKLYRYQIEGAAFLAGTGRALLADDMGLGKTLQAISAASWLRDHESIATTLIICPASLKQQWAREIGKFTDLASQIVQGSPSKRGAQYRRSADFFIINYELVLRDLSIINETLRPDLIILDEAQRIKNWRTRIASAVKLIPSRYAFVLSGTPLENRLEELYSLMQVVDPKVLGPLWRYMIDFHITDERGKVLGYRNLSQLRQRLAPVMLRRDRRLVREQLPDRIEQRLDVEMTDKQQELHDSAKIALFRGRDDVYPLRFESRKTGKSGYQPACANEWVKGLCDKRKVRCGAGIPSAHRDHGATARSISTIRKPIVATGAKTGCCRKTDTLSCVSWPRTSVSGSTRCSTPLPARSPTGKG